MKKIVLMAGIMFSACFAAFAQLKIENRLEIDLKEDDFNGHQVHLFGEHGFIIRSFSGGWGRKTRQVRYESYDKNIKFKDKLEIEIPSKKSSINRVFTTDNHIVELTYDMSGSLDLTVLDGRAFKSKNHSFKAPKGFKNLNAHFAGNHVVVVFRNKKAFKVFTANIQTGSSNVQDLAVGSFKPSQMTLESISSLENSSEAIICIDILDKSKKESGKRTNTYFAFVDCEKGTNKIVDVNNKIQNTLLTVSASKNDRGAYIITGTYTSKLKSSIAEGLFIAEISDGKVNFVEYNGFAELEEFLSYLPERSQQKMEKKKARKEKAGKDVSYAMRAIHHPLVSTEDAYFILAEYYYPTYRTRTTTSNGQTTTYTEFDGFRYTHASLVKYDLQGKMQWDRTFELTPAYKPFSVIRFISFAKKENNESITMVFCSRNKIISKGIRYSGGIEYDKVSEEIETGVEGDVTKRSFSDVDFWYDNYFLLHGSEVIKNKTGDAKRKRRVYYVSKLRF